jgi:hypothetical protein
MARVLVVIAAAALLALAAAPRAAASPPDGAGAGRATETDARRLWVAGRLVAHGRAPADALADAARLTAEDLEVLCGNPEMLRPAGALGETTWAVIIGIAIITLIVILAANGSGTVMVNL